MITAIFNKSKPINLVLASLMLFFGFLMVQFQTIEILSVSAFIYKFGLILLVILSALVVDFIVKKNALSGQNSFVIFFFAMFFFYFWGSNNDFRLILANLFILLALRKIISLKSQIATTKKIFDAALWICVASLFHFWSILFMLVLYLGIMLYVSNYYKNWLVPLVGAFVVFMIVSGYELIVNNRFFNFSNTLISTDYTSLNSSFNWMTGIFFATILIVSLIFLPSRIRLKLQKNKLSYLILIVALIIGIVLFLISQNKSSAMLIFIYFPLAILFTSFFEKITKPILQSVLLYSMFVVSVILCFISV